MRTRIKFFLVLLVLLTAALAVLFAAALPGLRLPRRAWRTEGPIAAFSLSAGRLLGAGEDPAALAAIAVEVTGCGANTLIAGVESAGGLLFSDKAAPPALEAADPLALLCDAANGAGVQVFARCEAGIAGLAPKEQGALLRRMLRHYPVAGLIVSSEGSTAAELAALADAIGSPPGHRLLGLLAEDTLAPDSALSGFSLLLIETEDPARLAAWQTACPDALVLPAAGGDSLVLDAQLLRSAAQDGLSGALLGPVEQIAQQPGRVGLLMSYFSPLPETQGFSLPGTLALSYPADGAVTTAESIVLLGSSDPAQPLSVSAGDGPVRASGGSFAAEVPLEVGENEITLSQPGGGSLTVTVLRKEPSRTWDPPVPDTRLDESLAGRYVEVTAQIASALYDPGSDGAIAMTLSQGGRIRVLGSAETLRSGKITTAWQLSSGDWLLSSAARLLDEEEGAPALLGAPRVTEGERSVQFTFPGGVPVCYDQRGETTLELTFYDAALDFDPALLVCRYVSAAAAEPLEGGEGVRLTLTLSQQDPLWGYRISYNEGETTLTLTGTPQLSGETGRPLSGITVLLDAGHGGSDPGALGIGGSAGLTEKELNLTLATAVRDRLTQLGAAVLMTREGDEEVSLQQRLEQIGSVSPDFFLALHHNSTGLIRETGAMGLEAYYFEPGSAAFAAALLEGVSSATGRPADDAAWNYFYVTRTTLCPAVLFEFGYLVNPAEFEDCIDSAALQRTADGVALGLVSTLSGAA